MIKTEYSKENSRNFRERKKWLSRDEWIAKKRAEETMRAERVQWELKRDEQMQSDMLFKEMVETWCEPRFENINNREVLKLQKGDQFFDALNYLAGYEGCVVRLQKHIPHLEYDPRIVHDCKFEFHSKRGAINGINYCL